MAELLRSVTGLLTPGVIQRAAALVGESPADTQQALVGRVVPTVVAALGALASSEAGLARLRDLIEGATAGRNPLGDLGALFAGGTTTQDAVRRGREQVQALFGGRTEAVVSELGAASGLQVASASSLLSLMTPVVLAALGADGNPDASALPRALLRERTEATRMLTPGLRGLTREVEATLPPVRPRPLVEAAPDWHPRALAVLAPLLLGGWLLWLWAPWRHEPPAPRQVTHRLTRLDLPGGAALDVPEGSFNHELARYLADRTASAPRTFVFEGLEFQTGRSALAPESQALVSELAAILKAFPSSEVRLEGHTDNVGNPDANQRLSVERAETVRAALIANGVEARRLDAAGFGQERPVTSNEVEEGRARNRRTELVVTRK